MRTALLLGVVLIGVSARGIAQQSAPADPGKLGDSLSRLESSDLRVREAGFDELMGVVASEVGPPSDPGIPGDSLQKFLARHPDQAAQVGSALIHALTEANHLFIPDQDIASKNPSMEPGTATYTEDDSEDYARLIDAVASLDDERAIPALVGAMTTGGMAQRGLLKYGDKALEPISAQLKNSNPLVRAMALGMMTTILAAHNDPASHARIKDLIRSSLNDPRPVVRSQAIREIACIEDREDFVPVLQQIAKTDPLKLPGKADDGGDGDEFYPVRFDARRALRDIRNNKVCTHQ